LRSIKLIKKCKKLILFYFEPWLKSVTTSFILSEIKIELFYCWKLCSKQNTQVEKIVIWKTRSDETQLMLPHNIIWVYVCLSVYLYSYSLSLLSFTYLSLPVSYFLCLLAFFSFPFLCLLLIMSRTYIRCCLLVCLCLFLTNNAL
jgi:hypothetical protein